jgi:hypothetical protein
MVFKMKLGEFLAAITPPVNVKITDSIETTLIQLTSDGYSCLDAALLERTILKIKFGNTVPTSINVILKEGGTISA